MSIEPIEDVADTPVNEIISSIEGESAPIEDVVDKPVNDTSREDSPQFSKPHVSEPQPTFGIMSIVSEPVADVVDSPVRVTSTSDWVP